MRYHSGMKTIAEKSPATTAVPSLFEVPCVSCAEMIAAHDAVWCHCVGKSLSLSCPRCGACLCNAGDAVQRKFWSAAPAWLVASRKMEQKRRAAIDRTGVRKTDVLIVDDDEEIRLLAAYAVEQMGYSVTVASSASAALDLIDQCLPGVVITDALMPKMDGRQLCQLIKASRPDVKVVVMTSLYTAPRYKYEAFKTFRADEYLAKPVDFASLRLLMDKLMPRPEQVQ